MAELKDRMMDDNFGIHSTAPMVNALEGGQMGPLVNQGKYIQNAHYIKKNVINSGVSKVMIERTSNKCYVTIYTSRPGFVIGKKGADIEKIKKNIMKITNSEVNVNIKEIKKPELNSNLVA